MYWFAQVCWTVELLCVCAQNRTVILGLRSHPILLRLTLALTTLPQKSLQTATTAYTYTPLHIDVSTPVNSAGIHKSLNFLPLTVPIQQQYMKGGQYQYWNYSLHIKEKPSWSFCLHFWSQGHSTCSQFQFTCNGKRPHFWTFTKAEGENSCLMQTLAAEQGLRVSSKTMAGRIWYGRTMMATTYLSSEALVQLTTSWC